MLELVYSFFFFLGWGRGAMGHVKGESQSGKVGPGSSKA